MTRSTGGWSRTTRGWWWTLATRWGSWTWCGRGWSRRRKGWWEMAEACASLHRWAAMQCDRPMARIERRRVMGEHVMISHVTLGRGFFVEAHSHPNEQMSIVVSGRLKFTVGPAGGKATETQVVGPGEML